MGTQDVTRDETRQSGATRARARTCAGCAEADDRSELVRLVRGEGGEIAVDARGGGFGRGLHVHARPECLARAASGGLARAAKAAVRLGDRPVDVESLAGAIEDATEHRIAGLLASALRAKHVAIGSDAVTGACQRGEAKLVVVARDAAAAAELGEVRRAVTDGRAVAWGSKASLASACRSGRGEGVAVVAILSRTIASALKEAIQVLDACATARGEAAQHGARKVRKSVESRTERGS